MFYDIYIMRTSLDIPQTLLTEAKEVIPVKTNTQAIILALSELIARRKSRRLLELRGSLKTPFDYKTLRRKR